MKSEKKVQQILTIFKEEYINPFSTDLEKHKLYNLSSGIPIPDDLAEYMLKTKKEGEIAYSIFVNERLQTNVKMFHYPIPRNPIHSFQKAVQKVIVKKNGKSKTIEVNRDILSFLLALSANSGKNIDYEKALQYPLCAVPLSLSNADGSRRSTTKSKLNDILMKRAKTNAELPGKADVSVLIVDLMALIQTMTKIPATYEEFTIHLFKMIPSGYRRVDIVADSYIENSIKEAERTKRGTSQKVIIQSSKSKVPRQFHSFLQNSENKTRLISLIKEVVKRRKSEILKLLKSHCIYFSSYKLCEVIDENNCKVISELSSDQEEADTKVCLHAMAALRTYPNKHVIIRSHSGDVDINILLTSLITDSADKVFVDVNTGKNRKVLQLSDIELSSDEKEALIGFHAFTGNDYVSSFFRKGKKKCWDTMKSDPLFLNAFKILGVNWDIDDETLNILENYVCNLYGRKYESTVNEARYKIFKDTYEKKKNIPDLSLLPPCQESFKLHCSRACFIAALWRRSIHNQINAPSPVGRGWEGDMSIEWIKKAFPDDVELLQPRGTGRF